MSTEGIDATEAAIVASILASDNVPDENQSDKCLSCGAKMQGLHCVDCGQKNDNYRRSIFALAGELFSSVFSLDSRIWRTWGALLFRPGKVAREFSDGRRMHWSSPVRVYLAMSIILFGFMAVTQTHLVSLDMDVRIKDGIDKPIAELTRDDMARSLNISFFERQKDIDARNENRDFVLIEHWLEADIANMLDDDSGLEQEVAVTEDRSGGLSLTIKGEKLGPDDSSRLLTNFMKNPKVVTDSFNKWLPRLMFIMMPFAMLIGALFIRDREKGLLFDHLVHAAYIHAVSFFLLFVGIVLSRFIFPGIIFPMIFIAMLIYLPISLKHMFGRGWFKTLFTSYSVGLIYYLVFMSSLLGLITYEATQNLSVV